MQVPDAIFHLMRETPLTTCNLASNIITKIPPKLAMSFTLITGEIYAADADADADMTTLIRSLMVNTLPNLSYDIIAISFTS